MPLYFRQEYGCIRISTDRQTTENQRFKILRFCDEKRPHIDHWVEGTISATKPLEERQLGGLLDQLQPEDVLIEIERSMISSRTKEALARKKSEGQRLGRPKGSYAKATKLTGQEQVIRELLEKRVSYSAIARILGVNRGTLTAFVKRHGLAPRPES